MPVKCIIFIMVLVLYLVMVMEPAAGEINYKDEQARIVSNFEQPGLYGQAVKLSENLLSKANADRNSTISDITALNVYLSRLYRIMGYYKNSTDLAESTITLLINNGASNSQEMVIALDSLAEVLLVNGHHLEARQHLINGIEMADTVFGNKHPVSAILWRNLGRYYRKVNMYDDALKEIMAAKAIFELNYGVNHAETFRTLDLLAELKLTTGDIAEAEKLFKQALEIGKRTLGYNHPDYATCMKNYARLLFRTGRHSRAEKYFNESLRVFIDNFGTDHIDVAARYNNLGRLYFETKRYMEAEKYFKLALSSAEKNLGIHIETAARAQNLARVYQVMGRYDEATILFERALAIEISKYGRNHSNVGRTLQNYASLMLNINRYNDSEKYYLEALRISVISREPELRINTILGYSHLLEKQSNPEAAIFLAKQGVNSIQGLRQNVSGLGKETLKTFTETVEGSYKRLANLLIEQGRLAEAQQVMAMLKEEEYFQYVRRSADTAPKLDTTASFNAAEEPWQKEYQKLSADASKLGKELGELREKQKKKIITEPESKRLVELEEENRKQTIAFTAYLERLIKGLREDARKLAEGDREKRLEDIGEKGLAKTSALRSTLKTLGEGAVVLHYLIMDEKLHILLTTPDIQLARQSQIKSAELNKKVFAFRELLKNPKADPRPAAKELYSILIAPVAKDLADSKARTLMLSLDGALRYIPFSALHDDKGYLAEQYRTVMYAEAARDKIALPALPVWQVAALGTSAAWPGFSELPSVPGELNSIVRSDAGGVIPGEIHLDRKFTKTTLQQASGRNPVLHIASHFKFVPGTDTDSFLLLGDGTKLTLAQVKGGSYFQESELLTLSACETAMGSSGKGTEIEGFGALAMGQGAKAVIATLWPVADGPTAQLMADFYRLREERKLPKVEALRQAQLALLNPPRLHGEEAKGSDDDQRGPERVGKPAAEAVIPYRTSRSRPYAHPYFWAPFILMGNWK